MSRTSTALALALAFTLGVLVNGAPAYADNSGAVVRALERIASALEQANRRR